MPDESFKIPLTTEQYANARQTLAASSEVTAHQDATALAGTFTADQIDFGYTFDGIGEVTVSVLKRHGNFGEDHAPLSMLEAKFKELLASAPASHGSEPYAGPQVTVDEAEEKDIAS